ASARIESETTRFNRNPYYRVNGLYTDGPRQVVTALCNDAKGGALVLMRDRASGRTLWKRDVQATPVLTDVGRGHGAVTLYSVITGAPTRREDWLLRLSDGAVLRRGNFTTEAISGDHALLIDRDEAPPSAAFLTDGSRLTGEVRSLASGKTLTRDFPIPARPGCGQPRVIGADREGGIGTNVQRYGVQGRTLTVPRVDECGQFNTVFDWATVPLPKPTQTGFYTDSA
uniref:hypothetical protein n=2 Tax=Deinococcus wulumuqiensis TaxID=980427 RepID=UPI001CEF910A